MAKRRQCVKKSTLAAAMTAVIAVMASATHVMAQTSGLNGKLFVSFEVGAQPQQRDTASESSFPLYDETATITATNPVQNGVVFNVAGGYKFRPNLGVSVGVNVFNAREGEASLVASIPDPVFFNRPRVVLDTLTGMQHRETSINLSAVYFYPIDEEFELVVYGGPTIFNVSHDVPSATVPSGQNLVTARAAETKTGFGGHVGVEGNYMFNTRYGAGIFFRYTGGTVDLPSVPDLTVGGAQVGVGFRVRF
jgi:hypothetical protein